MGIGGSRGKRKLRKAWGNRGFKKHLSRTSGSQENGAADVNTIFDHRPEEAKGNAVRGPPAHQRLKRGSATIARPRGAYLRTTPASDVTPPVPVTSSAAELLSRTPGRSLLRFSFHQGLAMDQSTPAETGLLPDINTLAQSTIHDSDLHHSTSTAFEPWDALVSFPC
ncbi:hypothetical protein BO71DRAFT_426349 [Aspergillus ellipticus CBS 707.79]|uniref:Uncharacterized protein n=1 Tax=Aspergillus ellipticus CBS 707.79 TaxID=1448320 RepID=A0A319DKV4_9EURO|nr:hypothetical protein BO71DRAFT_426349 [Aspergillus ellipticus CBS 707.79]